MVGTQSRAVRLIYALSVCALFASGCAGWQLPRIDPSGERIFLPGGAPLSGPLPGLPPAAVPGGPASQAVVVSPSQVVAPVGSEVVVLATVNGPQGYPLARQPLEWTIGAGSVGHFLTPANAAAPGMFRWPAYAPAQVGNTFVIGATASQPFVISRGTPDPADDIPVSRGQAWVAVTSPIEGTSHVSAVAPGVPDLGQATNASMIYWIDAQWTFPPPVTVPAGTSHQLVTSVSRHTDGAPVAGWHVRYERLGGVSAGLGAERLQVVEATTDAQGRATVEVSQADQQLGSCQIAVQVIRPDLPGQTPQRRVILGSGSTTVTWAAAGSPAEPPATPSRAPRLNLQINGPREAELGATVRFELVVSNQGDATATGLVITDTFDEGLKHIKADSPIERDLDDILPGHSATVPLSFQVEKTGRLCHAVEVRGDNGLRASTSACLQVAQPTPVSRPAVEITKTGPAQLRVGESARFDIEVRNTGNVPLTGIEIADTYDMALEPTAATEGRTFRGDEIVWNLPALGPGQVERLEVVCRCAQEAAQACNRVRITCAELGPITDEACLAILAAAQVEPPTQPPLQPPAQPPQTLPSRLKLSVADRADAVRMNDQVTYDVVVSNIGSGSDRNVRLSVRMSPGMEFVGVVAKPGGVQEGVQGDAVRFGPVAEVRGGETLRYSVRFRFSQAGTARLAVELTSDGLDQPLRGEETTEVLPHE